MNICLAPVVAKFEVFHNVFMYDFNICFPPTKTRVSSRKNSWFSEELIKEKEEIVRFRQSGRTTLELTLKTISQRTTKNYHIQLINTKKFIFISYISYILKRKLNHS